MLDLEPALNCIEDLDITDLEEMIESRAEEMKAKVSRSVTMEGRFGRGGNGVRGAGEGGGPGKVEIGDRAGSMK